MSKRYNISLPTDRDGNPIDVGTTIAWDDTTFTVAKLIFYGDYWTAESASGEFSDNLQGSHVVNKSYEDLFLDLDDAIVIIDDDTRFRRYDELVPQLVSKWRKEWEDGKSFDPEDLFHD